VEKAVLKILLAVDGSECSTRATRNLIANLGVYKRPPAIDLLAVHLPVPRVPRMNVVVSDEKLDSYYSEECEAMLAPSRAALDAAGVKYSVHHRVGPIADSIVAEAKKLGSTMICMGTRGMSAVVNAIVGSTATGVLHAARIPVLLIH
jgi:nucleotide-binding universal stress UspA family protein